MAFHHRKLLNESTIFDQKHEYCELICDSSNNPDRICPPECVGFCPQDCKLVVIDIPPPPPPAPPPPPYPVLHKPHALSLSLTISLSVLAACFFLFTCYTIYRFCSYWKRRPAQSPRPEYDIGPDDFFDEEHGPVVDHPIWYIRTVGLQPSVISAITIVKYKRGDGLIEGTDCSVCLNEFEEDETLRLLPKCNHAFHIPCIDTWLRSHTNCPMCRAGIVNNIAATIPSQEPIVHNSGPTEEHQSEISGTERDSENESPEIRPGIDDDRVSLGESGLKINEDRGGLDGIVAMRRSVSLDSLSASMISAAIANASDNQSVEVEELNRSNSIVQSEGTSSMKRSVSCSAKVLLSRHSSRSRSSHRYSG